MTEFSTGQGDLPNRAGVSLKPVHYDPILSDRPAVGWFEIHAENYMGAGGPPHRYLTDIRTDYPLSIHGVGLSLGGATPPDSDHMDRLAALVDRYQPSLVSEHLAWSSHDGTFLNDLLPVPYTTECLSRLVDHVACLQDRLGREVAIENPSLYVAFDAEDMSEIEFLTALSERTGCRLLLDVNNVYVSAINNGTDPVSYIEAFPNQAVAEIHLAGHAVDADDQGKPLLIDAHDRAVADAVWDLYRQALRRTGPVPTLIEWDNDVPDWRALQDQAQLADNVLVQLISADGEVKHAAAR